VVVPAVSNSISIDRYFDLAKSLLLEARKATDDDQKYVFYQRFLRIALERIPNHMAYDSKGAVKERLWLKREALAAMDVLENEIVRRMDLNEDLRLERLRDEALIDEFDGSVHEESSDRLQLPPTLFSFPILSVGSTIKPAGVQSLDLLRLPTNEEITFPPAKATTAAYPSLSDHSPFQKEECEHVEKDSSLFSSLAEGIAILNLLGQADKISSFFIPQPSNSTLEVNLGRICRFRRDDFHVSFGVFLQDLYVPPDLQISASATETNRCFWVHLGVALRIHPFALHLIFRYLAAQKIKEIDQGEAAADGDRQVVREILSTVLDYAGFVDAHILCFLWPREFCNLHICFLSNTKSGGGILTSFSTRGAVLENLSEILVHCDGSHFTLLSPVSTSFPFLANFLDDARSNGSVVNVNTISPSTSLVETLDILCGRV